MRGTVVRAEGSRRQYADLQGLGRAIAILEELADHPMRAKELAEALGIKWTTAYRTLAFLQDSGFLEKDESTGIYYVGPRLYYIGSSYIASLPIIQAARPYLKQVADETGGAAQLVQRDRNRSVALLVFEAKREYIPKTTIGFHFPLHCGAKGQVLLAHESPAFIDEYLSGPLEALTPETMTDPKRLRHALAEIRAQGYAVTRRDVQLSTGAVAAPIRDSSGRVVASLSVIVDVESLEQSTARLIDVIVNAADSVSVLLGWRPLQQQKAARAGGR